MENDIGLYDYTSNELDQFKFVEMRGHSLLNMLQAEIYEYSYVTDPIQEPRYDTI